VFTRTFDNIYPQFRLAPYFIVGNCCVRDGGGGGGGVWGGGAGLGDKIFGGLGSLKAVLGF